MSADTELNNMQTGIQQLLPDIATLSLLHRPPGLNAHHPHHSTMQPQAGQIFI